MNYTERRAVLDNTIITMSDHEVEQLLNLDERTIDWYGLRRGDVLTIETVETTVDIVAEKEYRYGFDGLKQDRQTNRRERVVSTEARKLWKTKARGWYWK